MSWWCATWLPATHGALIYLALLTLLWNVYWKRRKRKRSNGRADPLLPLLPNHTPFWLLAILLFLTHWAVFGARVLSPPQDGACSPGPWLTWITPLLGVFAVVAAGTIHYILESSDHHPIWLFPVLLYFLVLGCGSLATGWTSLDGNLLLPQLDLAVGLISLLLSFLLLVPTFKRRGRRKRNSSIEEEGLEEEVVYANDSATLLSRITFFWFTRLLRVGYSTPLEESHLGLLPSRHTATLQLRRFKGKAAPLLWPLLWSVVGPNMLLGGVFRLLADLSGFVAPLGIKTIVNWSGRNESQWEEEPLTLESFIGNGYVMVTIVLIASILQATFSQCSTYTVNTEGLHVKVAIQGMVYEKALRVAGKGEEISNLIGEDANNVMMFFWMAHFIWAIPLKLLILMGLLWGTLGWAALLAAALCILIMLPLQLAIAKAMSHNSKLLLERSDERLGWLSEMVANMRILKAHAWETFFEDRLKSIRKSELKHLDNDLLYRSLMTFLTHISTVIVTVVTFGLYPILEEQHLQPASVFSGLALFNQLTVPLFIFPITVPVIIDALVSGRRIAEFLSLPEMTKKGDLDQTELDSNHSLEHDEKGSNKGLNQAVSSDSVFVLENIVEDEEDDEGEFLDASLLSENTTANSGDWLVRLEKATLCWEQEVPASLTDITFTLPKGKLTVICGPTGSGKSSLVASLLGELRLTEGSLVWARNIPIAFAAQSPWILNGTVRENILFGEGFKGRRYKRVLEAVCLQTDLEILPEGDATEIGDHGIGLSGGQKQRIALARALYSSAPLVILDDPLSALDVEVASHVFDVGIQKLLSRRTVILVTHHLPALPHAHHIVSMESGRIRIQGSLSDIKKRDPELASHWEELIAKKQAELARYREQKTARERWTLLKLVSKIGIQMTRRPNPVEEARSPSHHFRSRKGTFSTYKNLSHDFFLPSDECHYDDVIAPILKRRPMSRASRASRASRESVNSGGKHVVLQRLCSLQPRTYEDAKFTFTNTRPPSVPGQNEEISSIPSKPRRFRSELSPLDQRHPKELKPLVIQKRQHQDSSDYSTLPSPLTPEVQPQHPPSRSARSEGEETEVDPQERPKLFSPEEREYGSVPFSIYLIYIKACGRALSASYLLFSVGYEVVRVLTSFWLSHWSDSVSHSEDEAAYASQMQYFFLGYVILSLFTVIVSFTCNILGKWAGARSRRILHDNFVSHLIRAPLSFFESTPIGRIMGRGSADMCVVDRKLVISVQRFIQFVFLCLSAVVVNGVANPWCLILAIPLVAVYHVIQRFYRISSRELQRIQAISRGPILSHFHETLQGLSTIRAYGRQRIFTDHMFSCIDLNNRADMFINVGNRWLSISLDYLGSVIVAVASIGAIVSADLGLVTPSVVGLAINYTLLVPVYLNWVVKFLAEVEMFMNSVDRLHRESKIETEEDTSSDLPPPSWPNKGEISFEEVSISYDETTPIVSSLSLTIHAGQKVGLCGRSGCGKSTLLSSLFRLSGRLEGRILIDGVDIHSLSLLALRSALCIIPQHSAIFTAPLRFNLDPVGTVKDKDMWDALELVNLKEFVEQLPGQLDEVLNPDSFSAGQRQLLALAVAILHKSRVVVMDEATSSVDADTEQIMMKVVASSFADSTVLSIAHRLGTIVNGDRIIVMEKGQIAEDGSPAQLLHRKSKSIFADMFRAEVQSK